MSSKLIIRKESSGLINGNREGDIIEVMPESFSLNANERLKHKEVLITDANVADLLTYMSVWSRKVKYEILNFLPENDFFRVRLYADPETSGVNPKALLTQAMFQDFLTTWGAEEITESDGEVYFEITAMDALNNGTKYICFGEDEEKISLEETAYDVAKGEHTIVLDYSQATVITLEDTVKELTENNCYVVSWDESAKQITFIAYRNIMIGYLEQGVRDYFDNYVLAKRQYSLITTETEMTLAEFKDVVHDIKTEEA